MKPSTVTRLFIAAGACLIGLVMPAAASANPYVALGDSVTAFPGNYPGLLYPGFQADLGANELLNRAVPGATSASILNGPQLITALDDINAGSDTKVVTAGIGGGDALFGTCDSNFDVPAECNFRADFRSILDQLKAALDADPGTEPLTVLAYYNPKNGIADEDEFDRKLLGANDTAGLCDAGLDLGLNDVILQEASAAEVGLADAYPAFKTAGQTFMSGDQIHPNDAGQAAIAQAFREAEVPPAECRPDPTPDTKAPKTSIRNGPIRLSKRSVKFIFKSSEKGSTFKCSVDGKRFTRCKSPKKLKRLKKGQHTFRVKATDAAGNADKTPAKRKFRIKR